MNKKGFTLVELLAILVVLGVIILVAMPALVESNRVAKINEKKDFEEMVTTACETYVAIEKMTGTVQIKELANKGYIKKGTKAPGGEKVENMTATATISNDGCTYTYSS